MEVEPPAAKKEGEASPEKQPPTSGGEAGGEGEGKEAAPATPSDAEMKEEEKKDEAPKMQVQTGQTIEGIQIFRYLLVDLTIFKSEH